jgi:hypothetical protein
MRLFGDATSPPKTCCCNSDLCKKIGYSHDGMLCPPSDTKQCVKAMVALALPLDKAKEIAAKSRNHRVAPWHYKPSHRKIDPVTGKWKFTKFDRYQDEDGKYWDCPPPNYSVQKYIDNEINPHGVRGGVDDSLPSWFADLVTSQESALSISHDTGNASPPDNNMPTITPSKTPRSAAHSKTPLSATPSTTPRSANKRKSRTPMEEELDATREELRLLQAKYVSAIQFIEGQQATIEGKDKEFEIITNHLNASLAENTNLQGAMANMQSQSKHITYDDLRPGGMLGDYVKDFTFFPDFKCNDLFLDTINDTDGRPVGDGFCENLARYATVSLAKRKAHNESDDQETQTEDGNSSDAGSGLQEIADEAMDEAELEDSEDASPSKHRGRRRKLHWKTEWLVYCFYVRCNLSMRRVAALFGVRVTLVHNIIYAWANLLCDILGRIFPVPTRSQLLQSYPKSVIQKFGQARIFMLLDATEAFADTASMKTVNSILYSAYKHHSTMKWLVGADPIGTVWNDSISDGHGGSVSDPVFTQITKFLKQVPFGAAVEVDKGFLIENMCAALGVLCVRPMKFLKNQKQQSSEDTALTQKVGKTRIPIEQANGQMKQSATWFDKSIRIDQIGLADLIFRSSYLLTNFKLGFIQGHDK